MVIFPRSYEDPTGQDRRERGAMKEFAKRFRGIRKDMLELLASVKSRKMTLSAPLLTNAEVIRYEFEVDTLVMDRIGDEIDGIVDRWLEVDNNPPQSQWFIAGYVAPAYQQGTAMAVANLSTQSAAYKATRQSLTALLQTDAYRTRLGYIQARSFEAMKLRSSQTKEVMRMALLDGMAQGMNPLDIANNINRDTDLGIVRSRRIARTEITTAMRRSRIEEAEQTTIDLGLNIRMMQLSALSPTTRMTHARRHGKLYTFEQAKMWMATSPNMINCKCTFVEVMVDDKGKPIVGGIVERAEQVRVNSGYDQNNPDINGG